MLKQLRSIGVDRVHMFFEWTSVAPRPTSRRRPDFDASDPAAYPAAGWAAYDRVIKVAARLHVTLDVAIGGLPPL